MPIEMSDDAAEFLKWLTGEELPATDPDKLRLLAEGHYAASDGLEQVLPLFVTAVNSISNGVAGKSELAFVDAMKDYLGDDGYLVVASRYVRRLGEGLEDSATQVEYTQIMIILTIIELMIELAFALAIAWLWPGVLQNMAIKLLVDKWKIALWLARLIIAVGLGQVVGVGLQVLMDVIAQAILIQRGHQEGWNVDLTKNAAAVGSWTGLVGVVMGAGGGVLGGLGNRFFRQAVEQAADRARGAAQAAVGGAVRGAAGAAVDAGAKSAADAVVQHGARNVAAEFVENVATEGAVEVVGEGTFNMLTGKGWQWGTVPVTLVSGMLSGAAEGAGDVAGTNLRRLTHGEDAVGGDPARSGDPSDTGGPPPPYSGPPASLPGQPPSLPGQPPTLPGQPPNTPGPGVPGTVGAGTTAGTGPSTISKTGSELSPEGQPEPRSVSAAPSLDELAEGTTRPTPVVPRTPVVPGSPADLLTPTVLTPTSVVTPSPPPATSVPSTSAERDTTAPAQLPSTSRVLGSWAWGAPPAIATSPSSGGGVMSSGSPAAGPSQLAPASVPGRVMPSSGPVLSPPASVVSPAPAPTPAPTKTAPAAATPAPHPLSVGTPGVATSGPSQGTSHEQFGAGTRILHGVQVGRWDAGATDHTSPVTDLAVSPLLPHRFTAAAPPVDTSVARAVEQLGHWDGASDCLVRVDSVVTALGVPGRGYDDDVRTVTAAALAARLNNGQFRPAAVEDLAKLHVGHLTIALTQHPNDPQHAILVNRPNGKHASLVAVETQADPEGRATSEEPRLYTTFDPTRQPGSLPDVPRALRGPIFLPVAADGRLLQVDTGTGAVFAGEVVTDATDSTALLDPAASARPGMHRSTPAPSIQPLAGPTVRPNRSENAGESDKVSVGSEGETRVFATSTSGMQLFYQQEIATGPVLDLVIDSKHYYVGDRLIYPNRDSATADGARAVTRKDMNIVELVVHPAGFRNDAGRVDVETSTRTFRRVLEILWQTPPWMPGSQSGPSLVDLIPSDIPLQPAPGAEKVRLNSMPARNDMERRRSRELHMQYTVELLPGSLYDFLSFLASRERTPQPIPLQHLRQGLVFGSEIAAEFVVSEGGGRGNLPPNLVVDNTISELFSGFREPKEVWGFMAHVYAQIAATLETSVTDGDILTKNWVALASRTDLDQVRTLTSGSVRLFLDSRGEAISSSFNRHFKQGNPSYPSRYAKLYDEPPPEDILDQGRARDYLHTAILARPRRRITQRDGIGMNVGLSDPIDNNGQFARPRLLGEVRKYKRVWSSLEEAVQDFGEMLEQSRAVQRQEENLVSLRPGDVQRVLNNPEVRTVIDIVRRLRQLPPLNQQGSAGQILPASPTRIGKILRLLGLHACRSTQTIPVELADLLVSLRESFDKYRGKIPGSQVPAAVWQLNRELKALETAWKNSSRGVGRGAVGHAQPGGDSRGHRHQLPR
ncbi:hypothetical protein [Micromonospora pisi]|nr:hypothetical protein [Micromonospora pisi]